MFKIYLKTAFRNLRKNKLFSVINISGLAIGIASFIIIMLYVRYESSYDGFFTNSDHIYRVYMDYKKGDHFEQGDAQVYNMSGPTLKKEFPEITDFVRLYQLKKSTFEFKNSTFEVTNGYLADPSWFTIFDYPLTNGDPSKVLSEPNTVVLTRKTADKVFGNVNPVGKILTVNRGGKETTLTVTGILTDLPENTYLKTNFLISFQTIKNWQVDRPDQNWNNNNFFTYLLVDKNTNITALKKKITEMKTPLKNERHNIEPLKSIHLYSDKPFEAETNGSIVQIRFFLAIALITLLLSWLNYINLSSAKSLERAKEVGVRKASGARKGQLVSQFLFESLLLNLGAIILACIIVLVLLPYFDSFTGKSLEMGLSSGKSILLLVGIPILGILLSGSYSAFALSGFKPATILKGKVMADSKGTGYRNAFIVAQFLAAIILLTGSITIYKQMSFVSDQPIGADLNQLISIKSNILDKKENFSTSLETLKEELKKLSSVESVSITDSYPGSDNLSYFMGITYPDGTKDGQTKWYFSEVDNDYLHVMGISLLAGQGFSDSKEVNKNKVIINETAARQFGFPDPENAVDQTINFWKHDWQISGVVKDYHSLGLKYHIEPLILRNDLNLAYSGILVKLNNVASVSGIDKAIGQIRSEWQEMFPKSSFQYNFVDEKFASFYDEDRKFGKAFGFFTFLSIFIASIGLFGLTFYSCNLRIKEIGIRKVNGAKISEILTMLNKDFVKWVIVAFAIATPIAWYAMNKWLESFAYKTELSWWIFALAGVLALGIALLTVSWQSWRAATRNPVEALRYE